MFTTVFFTITMTRSCLTIKILLMKGRCFEGPIIQLELWKRRVLQERNFRNCVRRLPTERLTDCNIVGFNRLFRVEQQTKHIETIVITGLCTKLQIPLSTFFLKQILQVCKKFYYNIGQAVYLYKQLVFDRHLLMLLNVKTLSTVYLKWLSKSD